MNTTDEAEIEALRRSEAQLRAVIEKCIEALSLTTRDGVTRYLTPAAPMMLGWTREELGTRTIRELATPADQLKIAAALDEMIRGGRRTMTLEVQAAHRDGSLRWIQATGSNLLDDPAVGAIVGSYRDITESKNAQAALFESGALLEEAQAIAHVGSWVSGIGLDDPLRWSAECYRIFGISQGTPMSVERFMAHVHPDDHARVQAASLAATRDGAPYDLEHRIVRPDGMVRWVRERGVVERRPDGTATRMMGTVQDITDQHQAARAMRQSEEKYRGIVENTSQGVWQYDSEGTTTFANAQMANILGTGVEAMIGKPIFAFMDESQRAEARARTERRKKGIAETSDFKLRRVDGRPVLVRIQANPVHDADGRFDGVIALVTDVSEQRRAEEATARLAAIVESSGDAIISTQLDGTITSWNRGAEKMFGFAAAEVIGTSSYALMPVDAVERSRQRLEGVARGEHVDTVDTHRLHKSGEVIAVALSISPLRDPSGRVVGVSKIERDLTASRKAEAALRRTEEQFRQAQKMEAVGRLAGGVAHDFNNLLSVILSYASMNLQALNPTDPLAVDMGEIVTAAERATTLTRQLLTFSRQQLVEPRVLDLNGLIRGMLSMLGRLLGEDIELAALNAADLGRVRSDPGQLEQVVMNLAVNARDAMPDGGKLTIETANVEVGAEYVGLAPGRYVLMAVSDTGVGMDAATQQHIFEPFFTTKEKGKGTGLGLSTVFGIVQQSGGHVSVYSEPGRGTTFKVYLPRTDRAPAQTEASLPAGSLRGSETILLVEDEQQVRRVACSILQQKGYHVLEASNGGEAFLISKQYEGRIHLLLTDVVMPRMSGPQLVRELAGQRPEMRVLFASGYTDETIIHHGILDAGIEFLQKPFTPQLLLRRVRQVLDTPAVVP